MLSALRLAVRRSVSHTHTLDYGTFGLAQGKKIRRILDPSAELLVLASDAPYQGCYPSVKLERCTRIWSVEQGRSAMLSLASRLESRQRAFRDSWSVTATFHAFLSMTASYKHRGVLRGSPLTFVDPYYSWFMVNMVRTPRSALYGGHAEVYRASYGFASGQRRLLCHTLSLNDGLGK